MEWRFPLPRTHCGIALGNGTQGALIWGSEVLCITVARAGFWDRRGGRPFEVDATFPHVRELLEANDEVGIKSLFDGAPRESGTLEKSYQIGGGRIELHFERGFTPQVGRLHFDNAIVEIELRNAERQTATIRISQAIDTETLCVAFNEAVHGAVRVLCRTAWEWCGEALAFWGVAPPRTFEIQNGGGFVQALPSDDALALAWRRDGNRVLIGTALGPDINVEQQAIVATGIIKSEATQAFWKQYWRDVPRVELPDEQLQQFWNLALYKQAGLTTPGGIAATLQGPWMEEYQLPPWSNDYHFNINAQMIYWPALATNRLEHFAPLWEMIREWMPTLRANAESFFERDGALMLPHAVDDRCRVVGSFWTGTIDHGCTAWVAQMAWLHYRHSLDETILQELAWPLMQGAFEGYWAMLEERDGVLTLPVSVSPEYRGSEMNAWGRDASFQLAALHMTAQNLIAAAKVLGEVIDKRWVEIEEKLPPYSSVEIPKLPWDQREPRPRRIALWDGLELEESHRHHSHLAAIFPFASIDPLLPEHSETVANSLHYWARMGAGQWTGWCLPWASVLCSRFNLPDAAVAWLHWLLDNYTNEGWGTRHNADFAGTAAFDDGSLASDAWMSENEVMQMDATMGFITAITELLVQNRRDGLHILPRLPRRWKELSFDGIRCEGAVFAGATVQDGKLREARVTSERGGTLSLHAGGQRFELSLRPGQTWQQAF